MKNPPSSIIALQLLAQILGVSETATPEQLAVQAAKTLKTKKVWEGPLSPEERSKIQIVRAVQNAQLQESTARVFFDLGNEPFIPGDPFYKRCGWSGGVEEFSRVQRCEATLTAFEHLKECGKIDLIPPAEVEVLRLLTSRKDKPDELVLIARKVNGDWSTSNVRKTLNYKQKKAVTKGLLKQLQILVNEAEAASDSLKKHAAISAMRQLIEGALGQTGPIPAAPDVSGPEEVTPSGAPPPAPLGASDERAERLGDSPNNMHAAPPKETSVLSDTRTESKGNSEMPAIVSTVSVAEGATNPIEPEAKDRESSASASSASSPTPKPNDNIDSNPSETVPNAKDNVPTPDLNPPRPLFWDINGSKISFDVEIGDKFVTVAMTGGRGPAKQAIINAFKGEDFIRIEKKREWTKPRPESLTDAQIIDQLNNMNPALGKVGA